MKIFNKETDYAVRALLFMAMGQSEGYVSATTLAREIGLPLNFLRRICSVLIKAEILEAREGAQGGVRLVREPDTINVLEIMELFRDDLTLSDCTFRKALCPNRQTCVLRKRILGIEDKVKQEFLAITLQSLIDDISEQK